MSGSEEIKNRLKETFSNSPMPDFVAEMNRKPSPLKAESKFSSHNKESEKCPNCGGDPIQKVGINKHCEYCDFYW